MRQLLAPVAVCFIAAACAGNPVPTDSMRTAATGSGCSPSQDRAVRRVQVDPLFDSTARAISRFTFRDSSAARSGAEWLCSQLKSFSVRGREDLIFVAGPAYYSGHQVDVVFAVRGDRIGLLSPWAEGRPTGGLAPSGWNDFVDSSGALRVTSEESAVAIACALQRVRKLTFFSAECLANEIVSRSKDADVWVFRFRPDPPDPATELRIGADGRLH